MNHLHHKYISLLSSSLRNFQKKSESLYNFSCLFCGDSKKNTKRARGYIYEKDGNVAYFCQKCKISKSLSNFIKEINNSLYEEYIKELYFEKYYEEEKIITKKPIFYDTNIFQNLVSIKNISENDPYKKYVIKRKIPEKYYNLLFKCENFKNFTNNIIPNLFNKESLKKDESRLLILFFSENKKLIGYTGRALGNSDIRYINIVIDESQPKLYGLERWEKNKKTYVVEGPIDSLFLDNCLATSGNDMVSSLSGFDKENFVIIYDNERRSEFTRKKIERAIQAGYKVCIWPTYIQEKDINDMIISGKTKEEITNIIEENTFQNIKALARLIV